MAPKQPDAALVAVVGGNPIPRTEITKKLWGYIKKNGLQDAKERRMINADDKLKRGVWWQGQSLDVRDDQAGQQAHQVSRRRSALGGTCIRARPPAAFVERIAGCVRRTSRSLASSCH